MNYRYTHMRFGDAEQSSGFRHDDEENFERPRQTHFHEPFFDRLGVEAKMLGILPWIGAASIGLGLLIIIFPMLLVMAVAGVFFFAGATCLGLWWSARARAGRNFNAADEWDRLKNWAKSRFA